MKKLKLRVTQPLAGPPHSKPIDFVHGCESGRKGNLDPNVT